MLNAIHRYIADAIRGVIRRAFPRPLLERLPAPAARLVVYSLMGLAPVMGADDGDGDDGKDGGGKGDDDDGGKDDDDDDDGDDGDDDGSELAKAKRAAAEKDKELRKLKKEQAEAEAEAKKNAGKFEELYNEQKKRADDLEAEVERLKEEHENEKRTGQARTLALAALREAKAKNPDVAIKELDLDKIDSEAKAERAVKKLKEREDYLFEEATRRQHRGAGNNGSTDDDDDDDDRGRDKKIVGPARLRRHFKETAKT